MGIGSQERVDKTEKYWMIKDEKLPEFGEKHVYSLKDVQWLPNRIHFFKKKRNKRAKAHCRYWGEKKITTSTTSQLYTVEQ